LLSKKGEFDNKKDVEELKCKVEDSYEILRKPTGFKYAIARAPSFNRRFYADIINIFGNAGGFDNMIERIIDVENPIEFELLYYFCDILGNCFEILNKTFVNEYVMKFYVAISACILKGTE